MIAETASGHVVHARVIDEPLDVIAHLEAVRGPEHGATDLFIGTIRDHDPDADGTVVQLEYEAHPDAESMLSELAEQVAASTGSTIAVSHRYGTLRVGDVAVVIASSAAHRAEALESTRRLIEQVKTEVAIWKRQTDANGRTGWVGL